MKPDLDPTSQEISQIDIELIKMTGGTQSRVELNKATVDEYAEAMQNDAKFPPIDLYHDGENYWLADGFHRVRAAQRANLTTILAHVHQGSRRDAILHSVKANAAHGLQRTNADKRKAVLILLEDGEWSQWSDNAIAKQCGVSQPFVSKLRTETTPTYNGYKSERKGLDGRVINTEGIGNNSKLSAPQENTTGSKEYTSVTQEIAAQGKSLGLPTRGDSVLLESDLMDKLTHTSCVDVDDRPGAYPLGGAIAASVESMLPEILAEEQPNSQHWIEEIVLEDGRKLFIRHNPGSKSIFNRTNEMVDWALWTWNPVTGCWHKCIFCYCPDIINRFKNNFPTKFEPTFCLDRLAAPSNTKVPIEASSDIRAKNVFVCSMGDLFGAWVPQDWIMQVFRKVIENPQWNFLFLTKFPQRLQEINDLLGGFPDNAWVGTSVDRQHRVQVAEDAFKNIKAKVKWLSCEPMLERLTFRSLDMFDWVVIGGQSETTQVDEFQPDWEWVMHLSQQARSANCEIYWKENLRIHPKGVPWQPTKPDALSTDTLAVDEQTPALDEPLPAIAPPESEHPAAAAPAEAEADEVESDAFSTDTPVANQTSVFASGCAEAKNLLSTDTAPANQTSASDDEPLKVGDCVEWDCCPGHLASWSPFKITAIEGDFAMLDIYSKPVSVSALRRLE